MSDEQKDQPHIPMAKAQNETAAFFDHQTGRFFRRVDWAAFWTSFIVSFGVYVYTLAPTVTLEDSGELAVAADYLGVPHPPGYPIWTLLSWLFQWVFHWKKYLGYPNPAWSVGLLSAFFGALACGTLSLLISRSGADMLRSIRKMTDVLGIETESLICWAGAVAGGLLLAFSPVLWSQSVIVEVYSLNAFFLVIILLLTYVWMCRPKDDKVLYITAFVFGLGLTNHQTLLFVAIALLAAIWFRDRRLFRDCFAVMCVAIAFFLFWKVGSMDGELNPDALREKHLKQIMAVLFLVTPIGLFFIERRLMTEWKRVMFLALLAALGVSFYAYMPFSSEQNPPMNWGYPRTQEGFKHAITRGQYERITPSEIFGNPKKFAEQVGAYFRDLRGQFTLPIALLGIIPFFFLRKIDRRGRGWVITTVWAFLSLSIILVIFLNPQLDIQTLFIQRVQLIQSHAIYALWIGYGLVFGLAFAETLLGGRGVTKFVGVGLVVLLPLVMIWDNAYNEERVRVVGGVEQNGHDFGWQFGAWELEGARQINKELKETEPPLPNPDYPVPMETNAIFFGGTDPGRFVPTYMIYSAKMRSDIYLITQNALADNTYMSVMRDLYGETIYIPSQQDSNAAFRQYVEDVQAGRISAGAEVSLKDGRVSVQGVQGVMMINGILARMIFDHNKKKHAFYVEESYVIPWMYPYLEPHGLIMKINSEPIQITPEMVKNDRDFWDWYTRRLLGNVKFERDVVARKTFSKLRSAIAGIYAYRRMFDEAEYAFLQAIDLYPLSPEANFRLADIYMQERKYAKAIELVERLYNGDPGNDRVKDFLNQIKGTEEKDRRRQEIERQFASGQADLNAAMELAELYQRLGFGEQFQSLTMQMLNQTNLPPDVCLRVGQIFANAKRMDLLEIALKKYLERQPNNPRIWIDLAAVHAVRNQPGNAIEALKRAVALGGDPVRDIARKDNRFDAIRNTPEFQELIPSAPAQQGFQLPFSGL